MHPPISTDLAPSDYHLFLALQNFLTDKKLRSREDCENRLQDVFANKDQYFHKRCIIKLPLKLQQIIQQNGAYLPQIGQSEVSSQNMPKQQIQVIPYCFKFTLNFINRTWLKRSGGSVSQQISVRCFQWVKDFENIVIRVTVEHPLYRGRSGYDR
ncbi:transposase [Trichonephila clavipes]|nr:transposase [Trichonephila clavipes]